MKNFRSILCLVAIFYLASCDNESSVSPQATATDLIEKIETSYKQGGVKIEGFSDGEKIETSISDLGLEKIQANINSQISEKLGKLKDRYRTARTIFAGYDVGVIPNVDACPSWSEYIRFFMDCQDGNSITAWANSGFFTDGYRGAWSIDGNKNVNLVFCRVDGRSLSNSTQFNTAALRLGANQPSNTQGIITRGFDNEDSNNTNYFIGDIAPNLSNSNTTLQFYVYNGNGTPADFGFGYGVLGGIGTGGAASVGELITDDEDRRNGNSFTLSNPSMYYGMIQPGNNTRIRISKQRD